MTFKEYAFQDANTLEATQTQIGTRVVTEFPLCDQEILLRHLHKTARRLRERYKATLANGNGPPTASHGRRREGARECLSCPRNSPTWSGSPIGACRPRTSATPSGWPLRWPRCRTFYDAGMPRLEDDHGLRRCAVPAGRDARRRQGTGASGAVDRHGEFPVEVWKQPRVLDSGASYIQLIKEPVV